MVFGKDQDASQAGKIGNQRANKIYGDNFTRLWKDKNWADRKREWLISCGGRSLIRYMDSMTKEERKKFCSDAGKKSRKREKIVAEKIKPLFDNFFEPSRVCDRIGIKDGKLIFIEIKKDDKDKLRPLQRKFKELCKSLGIDYEVHYAVGE